MQEVRLAELPCRMVFSRATLASAGISCRCISLSVCLSATGRYSTETAKRRITQTTQYDSPGILAGRPFVKRFALCYRTVVSLSDDCPSVTLVYCGGTLGWIKMPLGTEVDLGPGDTVLDGIQLAHGKGHNSAPFLGPCLLWPNGRPFQQLLSSCFLMPKISAKLERDHSQRRRQMQVG